jgi:hypothetical protein
MIRLSYRLKFSNFFLKSADHSFMYLLPKKKKDKEIDCISIQIKRNKKVLILYINNIFWQF